MRARLVSAVAAVATATLVPVLGLVGAQAAYAGGGNSGHLEVSEVGGPADSSNDPHVGCSFDLQWYGYQRSDATVRFESQAPTAGAVITKTQGPDKVSLGSAASGSVMNAARTYTLKFTGADPQANQGYHVKVSTDAAGAKGASGKYKVFWVECDRADAPTPTDPTEPGDNGDDHGDDHGDNGGGDNGGGDNDPGTPSSWDWTYDDPTCAGVSVDYPANIPDGQANDVNIRVQTPAGTKTLNFHNNQGTWSGTHAFDLADHAQWDPATASYHITWVQVGGTNYHWQGDLACVTDGDPSTADTPLTETEVEGFRTGTTTINRGSAPGSDSVVVDGNDDQDLQLQVWTPDASRTAAGAAGAASAGHWSTVRTVSTTADGSARVTFPKLTKKGTFKYRLAVAGTDTTTGDTTGTLTVRVR